MKASEAKKILLSNPDVKREYDKLKLWYQRQRRLIMLIRAWRLLGKKEPF